MFPRRNYSIQDPDEDDPPVATTRAYAFNGVDVPLAYQHFNNTLYPELNNVTIPPLVYPELLFVAPNAIPNPPTPEPIAGVSSRRSRSPWSPTRTPVRALGVGPAIHITRPTPRVRPRERFRSPPRVIIRPVNVVAPRIENAETAPGGAVGLAIVQRIRQQERAEMRNIHEKSMSEIERLHDAQQIRRWHYLAGISQFSYQMLENLSNNLATGQHILMNRPVEHMSPERLNATHATLHGTRDSLDISPGSLHVIGESFNYSPPSWHEDPEDALPSYYLIPNIDWSQLDDEPEPEYLDVDDLDDSNNSLIGLLPEGYDVGLDDNNNSPIGLLPEGYDVGFDDSNNSSLGLLPEGYDDGFDDSNNSSFGLLPDGYEEDVFGNSVDISDVSDFTGTDTVLERTVLDVSPRSGLNNRTHIVDDPFVDMNQTYDLDVSPRSGVNNRTYIVDDPPGDMNQTYVLDVSPRSGVNNRTHIVDDPFVDMNQTYVLDVSPRSGVNNRTYIVDDPPVDMNQTYDVASWSMTSSEPDYESFERRVRPDFCSSR